MFYDQFIELCTKRKVSPTRAALEIGLSKSTPTTWKKRGLTPQGDTLNKFAAYFNVSTDYLLGNEEAPLQPKKAPALTKKDERDIVRELEKMRDSLESDEMLMFDGDPLSDEAKESILAAMRVGMEMAKLKNKEKYTPKKQKNRKARNDDAYKG